MEASIPLAASTSTLYETIPRGLLDAHYNKESYAQIKDKPSKERPALIVQHLIMLRVQESLLVKKLSEAEQVDAPEHIRMMALRFIAVEHHSISALILAVTTGNTRAVELLLAHFVALQALNSNLYNIEEIINAVDKNGWSALHHAAFRSNQKIANLLMTVDGNPLTPTLRGLAYIDLHAMRSPDTTDQNQILFEFGTDDIRPIASDLPKFLEDTGMIEYRDRTFLPPGNPRNFASIQGPKEDLDPDPTIRMTHPSPTHFTIRLNRALSTPDKKEYELRTNLPLSPATFLGFYSGEILDPESQITSLSLVGRIQSNASRPHQAGLIDATSRGNLTRFANHGLPNSALSRLDREQPFGLRALITTGPIAAGKKILWSYGLREYHLSLENPCKLFRKKEIRALFKNGLQPFLDKIASNPVLYTNYLSYILDTPTALLYLHQEGLVPIGAWEDPLALFKVFDMPGSETIDRWIEHNILEVWIIRYLIMLVQNTEDSAGKNKERVTTWIGAQLEKRSIIEITRGLQQIQIALAENPAFARVDEGERDSLWDSLLDRLSCEKGEHPFNEEAFEETLYHLIKVGAVRNPESLSELRQIVEAFCERSFPSIKLTDNEFNIFMQITIADRIAKENSAIPGLAEANPFIMKVRERYNREANAFLSTLPPPPQKNKEVDGMQS